MVAMKPAQHTPKQNLLLATLPAEIFERLSPQLELISMPLGEVLYESGGQLRAGNCGRSAATPGS